MTFISTYGRAVLGATALVGASAALAWLEPRYISAETSQRMLGVLLGSVVVIYSNAIPKYLVKRQHQGRPFSAAEDHAARRFAGWSMVLGGTSYMLSWLLAPIEHAPVIGGTLLATGLLAAIARCLRPGFRRSGT